MFIIITKQKFVQIQNSVFHSGVSEYLCRYCIIQVYKGIVLCNRLAVRLNYTHRILMKLYTNTVYVICHSCELSPEIIQSECNMLFYPPIIYIVFLSSTPHTDKRRRKKKKESFFKLILDKHQLLLVLIYNFRFIFYAFHTYNNKAFNK